MNFLALYCDPGGLPRAFGKSPSREDAIAIATIELAAYREEKRKLGDPLADARFELKIYEGGTE